MYVVRSASLSLSATAARVVVALANLLRDLVPIKPSSVKPAAPPQVVRFAGVEIGSALPGAKHLWIFIFLQLSLAVKCYTALCAREVRSAIRGIHAGHSAIQRAVYLRLKDRATGNAWAWRLATRTVWRFVLETALYRTILLVRHASLDEKYQATVLTRQRHWRLAKIAARFASGNPIYLAGRQGEFASALNAIFDDPQASALRNQYDGRWVIHVN